MASRYGNWFLNVGLAIAVLVAGVLGYSLLAGLSTDRPDPRRHENPGNLLGDIIQVEVLNGCGVSGVAGDMTMHLRSLGFDVVHTGNHSSQNVAETVVIDRTGNMDAARQVAVALGLPEERVQTDVSADHYLDATVILGVDYESVKPFVEIEKNE